MLPTWYVPPHLRKRPRILIATVMKIVEEVFEVPLEEIKSSKRHQKIAKARQAACWLLRRYCEHASFLAI